MKRLILTSGLALVVAASGACAHAPGSTHRATELAGSPATLLVVSSAGVAEVDRAGVVVRRLSSQPAQQARRVGDVVYVLEGPVLARLSLVDGSRRPLARLPEAHAAGCPSWPVDGDPGAFVQRTGDFRFDAGSRSLCVRIQDRNDNMMEFALDYRVDLASGDVATRVVRCDGREEEAFACDPREAPRARAELTTADYRLDDGALVSPSGTRQSFAAEFNEESTSVSGRWALLTGLADAGGDYLYRSLLLLDRTTGEVRRILPAAVEPPLDVRAYTDTGALHGGLSAAGESQVAWIRLGDEDALVVDALLVFPGRAPIELEGVPIL